MKRALVSFANSWAGALVISAVLAVGALYAFDVNALREEIFGGGKAHPVDVPNVEAHPSMADHTPEARNRIFQRFGLALHFYLLSPAAFGVETWTVGDRATYEYTLLRPRNDTRGRRNLLQNPVTVEVVGDIDAGHALVGTRGVSPVNQWLRIHGLDTFRDTPTERYVLATPEDLRPSERTPLYEYQPGYFPGPVDMLDLAGIDQLSLEPAGRGRLTTPAGTFDCDVFTSWVTGKPLRIWVSPDVPPLGIVKISSETEELVLTDLGEVEAPRPNNPGIESLLRGTSILDKGCMSCHADKHDCHSNRAVPL